jgi:glycosyltransferase involved in cell wall biosynthesis
MRLILLAHPASLGSVSMPRFADMISRGMANRGHEVKLWTSGQTFGGLAVPSAFLRKWLGYVDQFLIYPRELAWRIRREPADTVFVVTDQALGMWVPGLVHRPHVIHCHDFLALRSARGEFPENPTGWTGRQYQRLIRNGFARGKAFISVSQNTRADLHRFLGRVPELSEVVYNGLNHPFRPMDLDERISRLRSVGIPIPERGMIVHVGGNQWYKNRMGVLAIYRAYVARQSAPPPLWMIGTAPTEEMRAAAQSIPPPGAVQFLTQMTNEQVNAAYAHARALLFPSLGEGFGWPLVEAMAADCPVITTDLPPMTEVAGGAARLIPRMPFAETGRVQWAETAATALDEVVRLDGSARNDWLREGRLRSARFDAGQALVAYEGIYAGTLAKRVQATPATAVALAQENSI